VSELTDRAVSASGPLKRRLAMGLAAFRRRLSDYEERLRSIFWGDRLGFELRPSPSEEAIQVDTRKSADEPWLASGRLAGSIGMLAADSAAGVPLPEAARFYGLALTCGVAGEEGTLLSRALEERWPLIGVSARGLTTIPEAWKGFFQRFLSDGGALFLHDLEPRSAQILDDIARTLDVSLPVCRQLPDAVAPALFSGTSPDLTREFAGVRIDGC
jgi:hypothetical protein